MEGESEQTAAGFLRFDQAQLLPDLSTNIKCGNSLIGSDFYKDKNLSLFGAEDMHKVNAFDWEGPEGFPAIMKGVEVQQDWKTYLITWPTYGSRISEEMVKYGTQVKDPVVLSLESRQIIADALSEKIIRERYRVLACNVLSDHVHCVVVTAQESISDIIRNLKGYSSSTHNRMLQLSAVGRGRQVSLWARGSNKTELSTEKYVKNAIEYVWNNHHKHDEDSIDNRKLKHAVVGYDQAYLPEKIPGGFDVVIGNPPYVKNENLDNFLIKYAKKQFKCATGFFDIFQLFIEKGFNVLNLNGYLSFIIPSLFLKGMNYQDSRKFLFEQASIKIIRDYGDGVFKEVQMPTFIIVVSKNKNYYPSIKYYVKQGNNQFKETKIKQVHFKNQGYIYSYGPISFKVRRYKKLKDLVSVTRGLEIGKNKKVSEGIPIIFGEDIKRYAINSISFIDKNTYQTFKKEMNIFENFKIVIRETGDRITATFNKTGLLTNRSLYCIRSSEINLRYLLGIINSTVLQYFYKSEFKANTDIFPKIRIGQVKELPIKVLDLSNPAQKSQHDKMVSLVEQMLTTQKKLHETTSPIQKKQYQQQTDILDKQIDGLVYELYELTPEEIKVVGGGEEIKL